MKAILMLAWIQKHPQKFIPIGCWQWSNYINCMFNFEETEPHIYSIVLLCPINVELFEDMSENCKYKIEIVETI